jgi:hypothetical protein
VSVIVPQLLDHVPDHVFSVLPRLKEAPGKKNTAVQQMRSARFICHRLSGILIGSKGTSRKTNTDPCSVVAGGRFMRPEAQREERV